MVSPASLPLYFVTNLLPLKKDFEEIQRLGIESGILTGKASFEDYTDTSFVRDDAAVEPYAFKAPTP